MKNSMHMFRKVPILIATSGCATMFLVGSASTACFSGILMLDRSTPPISMPMAGLKMSSTTLFTILPNAAPMITPTARSSALPLTANSLNSWMIFMVCGPWLMDQMSSLKPRYTRRSFWLEPAAFAGL